MQFGKQNRLAGWWYSWPAIAVYSLFVFLMAQSVYERYHVEREMAARTVAAQASLAAMQAREDELHERVQYLEGERGVEEEIRKNFDVARTGEKVVILQGETPATDTVATEEVVEESAPWYVFWR